MNLRSGIDTPPPREFLLVKVNLPTDDRDVAVRGLRDLEEVRLQFLDPSRTFGEAQDDSGANRSLGVVSDHALNLLVGFGLRFFMGPLEDRGQQEVIANFPPAGVIRPRRATRFDIELNVPTYLRTMNAEGDRDWVARRLGGDASESEIDAAYQTWLSDSESDLVLYFESNDRFLKLEFWDAVQERVIEPNGWQIVGEINDSNNRGDGRDFTGWHDPVSNMDDLIADNPLYYRSKIYLPHPAPAYPGDAVTNRDDPRLDGGTYMVHRKYIQDLDKWNDDSFTFEDPYGHKSTGEEARQRAVGRERESGDILCGASGRRLAREKDATEVSMAFRNSHVLQARGGMRDRNPAPFRAPFPPLVDEEENVFNIQDIRIRRRGGNWRELMDGKLRYGLHFICFQNNIQQTGFEFINNIWLMNPLFRGVDHIMDPERGIAEPLAGCYYFVPPEHRHFPGDVFLL